MRKIRPTAEDLKKEAVRANYQDQVREVALDQLRSLENRNESFDRSIDLHFGALLDVVRAARTDERSARNRALAIVITQLELTYGYFKTYVGKA